MIRGLILVKTSSEASPGIVKEAKKTKGVTDAYSTFGRFDVVIFIEAENFPALKEISKKIHGTPGIRSTETLTEGD